MRPKIFPEVDTNMKGEGCGDLPVIMANSEWGITQFVSCWEVTDEDLELIKETREVWLSCYGMQVPVNVSSEKPFQPARSGDDEFPDVIDVADDHFS